jgi:putative flavoprotein involved in K+ transport
MLDSPQNLLEPILDDLNKSLAGNDPAAVAACFAEECYWRDLLAFTWNIKTVEGHAQVIEMLESQLSSVKPSNFAVDPDETVTTDDGVTTGWIKFETGLALGYGQIRVKDGKIWTLLTTIAEIKDHPENNFFDRPLGVKHGAHKNRTTWPEDRAKETAEMGIKQQPYVLIVGGGQGGIAMGARLRALGVPFLIVEKNDRPGDSWRKRYKSLCLHDPVWYDHFPYLKYPDNWPVFAPKDKIGDWMEMYTKLMELNYWTKTSCKKASYDDAKGEWTVTVEREGKKITLKPKQLVLATGMSGKPNIPEFKGMERFKGDQHHSSKHPGPDKCKGKKVVVIGSNNSAHDICAALWENGVDVTMVQRSSTHVVKSESLMEIALGGLYSQQAVESGVSTEKADLIFASIPYGLMADFQIPVYQSIKERDQAFYDDLEKAGFLHDWGVDNSGLFMKYLRRGSGYYIDVGASQLIIDGKIKLEPGSNVKEITETSVILENGKELEADVIVYATGYNSMNGWAADLISQEVADKVGKCWGIGSDTPKDPGPWVGEQRNMWKPTLQDGLWFHGGNLHQSRHYSLYLAMQLKARMENLPIKVFGIPETYHKS